jgi:PAS domain S-box-containing protein
LADNCGVSGLYAGHGSAHLGELVAIFQSGELGSGQPDALAVLTVVLLLAGAVVLGHSAMRTRRLLRILDARDLQRTWWFLFGLMVFFILGYGGAVVIVGVGDTAALVPVTGLVFFSGAVFVLLVVRASHRSIGQLVEMTGFLDDVLDSMGEALLVVSEDGTIERVNPAAIDLFGQPHADIVGRQVDDFFADRTRPFDGGDEPLERTGEAQVVTAAGETVPVLFSASRLAADVDSGRGVVCIVRDITGRKRHELELERQNDRLEGFASVVSHDLRNPLSIAQGYLDIARETGSDEHFERIEQSLNRIDRLSQGLLELARQGKTVGDAQSVPLDEVVRVAWATVDSADATLTTDAALGTVQADRERLRQALENLFSNAVEHGSTCPRSQAHEDAVEHGSTSSQSPTDDAVEHGDDGATVTVGRLVDGTGFFVADDGAGVPPDERDAVFSHGFSTTDDGTGLGLVIVRTIVDAHGWDVVLTESESGGARFEVLTDPTPPVFAADGPSTARPPTSR